MNQNSPKVTTFLTEIAPWVRGKMLAIYLKGRDAPITGLVVKHVGPNALIARWNSSTHLVPLNAIAFIRFAPDCDPCRDTKHPLHSCVSTRKPSRRGPPAAAGEILPNVVTVGELVTPIAERMTNDARTSKLTPAQAARLSPGYTTPGE